MTRPFSTIIGVAVPLLVDDINTDQITPAQASRSLHPNYAAAWFSRWRLDAEGREIDGFVLNDPAYRTASILVTGRNFGCGSAREGAVWAMVARGVRCIIARSFADLYRANCIQNGVLPIVFEESKAGRFETVVSDIAGQHDFSVDLDRCCVTAPTGEEFIFTIDPAERTMLLEGLDDIGLSMRHAADIVHWEQSTAREQPWLQDIPQRGGG